MRNNLARAIGIGILGTILSGFTSCQPERPVVVAQLGPQNQKLLDEQTDQIKELKEQIAQNKVIFGKVAGNAFAIDIGVEHIEEDSRGKAVVTAENKLIKEAVGEPPAEEKAAGQARALSVLQNDLVKQKELYGKAQTELQTVKDAIAAKDKEIRDRDQKITEQAKIAAQERVDNAKKIQDVVNGYEDKIQKMKDEQAQKERRMWINTLRYGGLGVILLGIVALAVTSGGALVPGLILIGSGSLVILIGVAIDVLTAQKWFPYAAGIVALLVVGGVVLFIMHLVQVHKLVDRSVAVLNDMKTENTTLAATGDVNAKSVLDTLQANINYRFGTGANLLQKAFVKTGLDSKLDSK